MVKIAGVVVLYYPKVEDINNIYSYIEDIDKLYVIDNTPEVDNKRLLPDSNKIDYIFNGENVGVAKALNIAARKAIKEGYNWLLTMDQDSSFKKDSIEKIKDYIKDHDINDVGIVTPLHRIKVMKNKLRPDIEYPIDVMTSGNFVNLDVYQKIGGYKDWLFIDAIDTEYCLNLWSSGYKVVRLNFVEMDHVLGNIIFKKMFGREFVSTNHNHIRRYYIMRNNHYVRDMYVGYNKEYCEMLVKQKGNIMKILLFEKDKFRKIRESIRGYIDYKKNIKGKYHYNS